MIACEGNAQGQEDLPGKNYIIGWDASAPQSVLQHKSFLLPGQNPGIC
jgi:hypothetical protein